MLFNVHIGEEKLQGMNVRPSEPSYYFCWNFQDSGYVYTDKIYDTMIYNTPGIFVSKYSTSSYDLPLVTSVDDLVPLESVLTTQWVGWYNEEVLIDYTMLFDTSNLPKKFIFDAHYPYKIPCTLQFASHVARRYISTMSGKYYMEGNLPYWK